MEVLGQKMRLLTEIDYYTEAEPALRNVFLNDDPRNQKFGVKAELRKLLYEYRPPDPQLINAIIKSASNLGDEGFYLSTNVKRS